MFYFKKGSKYEPPKIIVLSDVAEGIYASSGIQTTPVCGSIYMKGIYQKPTYNPIEDGYKVGRGCEGCPAWNGQGCRIITHPEELNFNDDFRPSWKINGHKPDEKGY